MKKGLPPRAGINLSIYTGSVDMVIYVFLMSSSVPLGPLRTGCEIFLFLISRSPEDSVKAQSSQKPGDFN